MRHNSPHPIRFTTSMLAGISFLFTSWVSPAYTANHHDTSEVFHLTSHNDLFSTPEMMSQFSYESLTEPDGFISVLDHVFSDFLSIENIVNLDIVNFLRSLDGRAPLAHVNQDNPGLIGSDHSAGTTIIADSLPRVINTNNIVPPLGSRWSPPHFNIDNDQSYLSPWVEHANNLTGPYHTGLGKTVQIETHDIIGDSPWRNANQNSADAAQVAFSGKVILGKDDTIVGNYTTYGQGIPDSMISSCAGIDNCTGGVVQIGSEDDIGFNPQIGQFPWNVVNGVAIESTNSSTVGTGADIIGPHISIGDQDIIGNHVRLIDLNDPTKFLHEIDHTNASGNLGSVSNGVTNSSLSMNIDNDVTIYGSQFANEGAYTLLSGNINVDPDAMIGADSQIINTDPNSTLTIGIGDIIGMDSAINSSLNAQDWVSSYVIVAPDVHIGTAVFLGQADHLESGSYIGNDVYLPPGVTVAPGVSIGAHNTLPASIFTPGTVIDTDINAGAYNTPLPQALPSGPETIKAIDLANHTTEELKVSESLAHGVIPITMQTGSLNDPDLVAQVNASVDQAGFLEIDNQEPELSSSPQEKYHQITNDSKIHSFVSHLPAGTSSDQSLTTQGLHQFLQAWEDLVPNMGQQSLVSLLGGHGTVGNLNLASLSIATHDHPTSIGTSSLSTVTDQGIEGFILHILKGLSLIDEQYLHTGYFGDSLFANLFEDLDKDFSELNTDVWQLETHTATSLTDTETSLLTTISDGHLTDPWIDWIGHQLEGLNMLLDAQDQFFDSVIGLSNFTPNTFTRQLLITGLPTVVSTELLSNGDIGGIEGFIDQELAADVELAGGISDL